VLHEVDDQLGERSIELAVTERQPLSSRDLHVYAWMPLCSGGHKLLRRINRSDQRRSEAFDEFGRQRTRAAADVEYALAR
jgi:CRISPR/Cas system-associated protein Csm6